MGVEPDVPKQNYKFLRKIVPGFLRPHIRAIRKRLRPGRPSDEPFRSVYPYTLVHPERQRSISRLLREVDARKTPGAIIECGVLDGGTAALMALCSPQRKLHLFDCWDAAIPVTEQDGKDAEMWANESRGGPAHVRRIMRRMKIDTSRVIFHKGLFSETFPNTDIEKIAFGHIDADFYDSVKLCLYRWYPRLSPGGYFQFDDYTAYIGCRRAVDEFINSHPEITLQNQGGVVFYIQKPMEPNQ